MRILDLDGEEVGSVGMVRGQTVDFRDLFVSAAGKVIAPILDPEAAAICPGCGALYRSGISTCGDCQVPLHLLNRSSARG